MTIYLLICEYAFKNWAIGTSLRLSNSFWSRSSLSQDDNQNKDPNDMIVSVLVFFNFLFILVILNFFSRRKFLLCLSLLKKEFFFKDYNVTKVLFAMGANTL